LFNTHVVVVSAILKYCFEYFDIKIYI
jgi:hypothetical protein